MKKTPAKKIVKIHHKTKTTDDLSPDAKLLIVILLLLFAYPIGLLFMWVWMDEWPTWLKILITLPVFLTIIMLFVFFLFLSSIIKNATMHRTYNNGMYQNNWRQNDYNTTVTPAYTESPTPVVLPSTDTTY